MMNKVILDVKDIIGDVGAEEAFEFEQPFNPIEFEQETYEFVEPVKFTIRVQNTGSGVRVRGHVTASIKLICSRCLEQFGFAVDWNVDEIFYSGEPPEEDSYRMRETSIDLGAPTEEQFVLALPMKPLCKEACGGICATCGQPLDESHEPHPEEHIDPRLEVLKKLLDE